MAGAPKGRPKPAGSGRQKGGMNKKTKELKELVFSALHADEGAEAWLRQQKHENPVAFMTLLGKFVPRDLNLGGQPENPIVAEIRLIPMKKNGGDI